MESVHWIIGEDERDVNFLSCDWSVGSNPAFSFSLVKYGIFFTFGFRTKEWFDDMQRTVSCVRNKVEITSHLSSSSTREAVVQEYISWETGVLRLLDGDLCAAIFSLENVWLENSGECKPIR